MITETGNSVVFDCFYSDSNGVGVTGLTVTVDVYDPTGAKVVSNASATSVGGGFYNYAHTLSSAGNWIALFKTTGISTQLQLPALWIAVDDFFALQAGQASITGAISAVQTTANTIATQTDTLESGQASITSAIGTLQTTANTIVGYTDGVESALTALQADVDTITPPGGVYIVTIEAVAGAQIGVRALGFQWSYTADAGGLATAHLGAGDYEIIGFAGGYIVTPQTVTISADATITMTCTPVTLPAAIDPALCACYIDLREAVSNAVPSALPTDSRIRIKTNPAGTTADYSNAWTAIDSGAFVAGRITLELPRFATVEFCIPGYVAKSVITVPDEASANISGLFP